MILVQWTIALLACVAVLINLWTENTMMLVLLQPLTTEVRFVETQGNFEAAEQRAAGVDRAPFHFVLAH